MAYPDDAQVQSQSPSQSQSQLTNLLNLFLNPVIFDVLIAYLPLQALSNLSQINHAFHDFVFQTPRVFRYLDLSRSRRAYIGPEVTRIDQGGNIWRSERMDENLTEDEFYAGPLRGVFSILHGKRVLSDVQVLILDELASVTTDLIVEIATRADLNVKILSVRRCVNVNESRLQGFLKYLCRAGRSEGTPRLQGLYFFTEPGVAKSSRDKGCRSEGVMVTDGATLGVLPVDKSRRNPDQNPWYAPSGPLIKTGYRDRTSWEETIMSCAGIIAFDAVLCTHMHMAMAECLHDASRDFLSSVKPGISPIATVALGPEGCAGCGMAPRGSPVWGECDIFSLPLLWPPPQTGRVIDAVRPPLEQKIHKTSLQKKYEKQRLIVSCKWCLDNRHCDSCHRWWCAECYNPKKSKKLSDLEPLSKTSLNGIAIPEFEAQSGRIEDEVGESVAGDSVKVFNGLCVEDCLVGEMMSGAGSFGMWA